MNKRAECIITACAAAASPRTNNLFIIIIVVAAEPALWIKNMCISAPKSLRLC